ncbi:MAG: DMT family transporter [Desulfobacterales bacterium]|nr:DMT family transporter [Desulfobacterales bacterium]
MPKTDYTKALFSVLFAGTLWSFGGLTVRYMEAPQDFRWQYLFFRGLTVAVILCLYLISRDGVRFAARIKKLGKSGVIGAIGLLSAFIFFIWSITLTTVANTLFLYATTPFVAAFLGILILKERIRMMTWIAMTVAVIGISVMVMEGLETGNLLGTLTGFLSACGFAVFSISLRYRKDTPQFATIALAGILCAALTFFILGVEGASVLMPVRNILLSMIHGALVGVGLIFFSFGAKHFTAAELNLLSLIEVVGGVVWVYLPVFGINEVPSVPSVVGGCILSGAILLNCWGDKRTTDRVSCDAPPRNLPNKEFRP